MRKSLYCFCRRGLYCLVKFGLVLDLPLYEGLLKGYWRVTEGLPESY